MDCVVIGSGIAGLTSALVLARQGLSVTVLEAGPHPAPLLRGFSRGGLRFETGFHYGGGLHQGGLLRRWFSALGLLGGLRNISTDHSDVFCFADGACHELPSGQDSLLSEVERNFPGTARGMRGLFATADAVLAHSPYTNPRMRGLPSLPMGEDVSVRQYFVDAAFPVRLRTMLEARCMLYGAEPELAGMQQYSLVAGPYFQSSGTWDGGGAALVDSFLEQAAALGVKIRCRAPVATLELGPGAKLEAVRLKNGERLACGRCFFTGNPRDLERMLPQGALRPVFFRRIAELPESSAAVMIFAETDGGLDARRNLYFLPAEEGTTLSRHLGKAQPVMYLHVSRPQGPDGRQAVTVLALAPPADAQGAPAAANGETRGQAYLDWKQRMACTMRCEAERRYPALRGRWKILDAATPRTQQAWVYGSTGSLYGIRHDRCDMPLLPVTRLPGLFLAGQNILLPGVLGGIISGAIAAGFAIGHDAVLEDFRQ